MKPIKSIKFRSGYGGPGNYICVERELWPVNTPTQAKKAADALNHVRESLPRLTADVWRWDGEDFHETDVVFDVRNMDDDNG